MITRVSILAALCLSLALAWLGAVAFACALVAGGGVLAVLAFTDAPYGEAAFDFGDLFSGGDRD